MKVILTKAINYRILNPLARAVKMNDLTDYTNVRRYTELTDEV